LGRYRRFLSVVPSFVDVNPNQPAFEIEKADALKAALIC
jgi:hypothetical protein